LWSPLGEFPYRKHRKVMLLDNNLLAHPDHEKLLIQLIERRLEVCICQGLDIRLIDSGNAKLLKILRHRDAEFKRPRLYFSWDILGIEDAVVKGVEILKRRGIHPNRLFFYMLCGFDVSPEEYTWDYFMEHDWYRYERLKKLGVKPFIMKYNGRNDIPLLNAFARWVDWLHKARLKELGLLESFKSYLKYDYGWRVRARTVRGGFSSLSQV